MTEQRTAREWQTIAADTRPKVRYWVPGAAMDDEDLVTELKALKARGFGGVEVVPLLACPFEIENGEDGWGTPHWNHVLSVIDDTCLKLGMTMDVANGPKWPISMPGIESADDPAALTELTYGVIRLGSALRYHGPLPERRVTHEEGTPYLLHVMAYLQDASGSLVEHSYVDLSDHVTETESGALRLNVDLEDAVQDFCWLIFAFYVQPAAQKTADGLYYVIDHLSPEGVKACEAYWEPLLEAYNGFPAMESIFCDSLEYQVSLDWTPDFPKEFEARRGYSILPYLPFIGYKETYPESDAPGYHLDHIEVSDMVAQDYYETLTRLYCEYHLKGLETMAERMGKTIRYQVAYNKPYDEERCPLFVAIPENEALGRPSMDGLKTMAAAAHLGRKQRYSFECAAEFAGCYGQDAEDLFWWIKRALMSGMNAQVLHGASYSGAYHGAYSRDGYMEGVEWPGYEAFWRVVSNNWNRTLSVPDARGCMDTIARMNTIFRSRAQVDCAIYRASYKNAGTDSEFCYFQDDGKLENAGYVYETISQALLGNPNCIAGNGLLDPDGAAYQCLMIPPQETASTMFLDQVASLLDADFPVIWFGKKPVHAQFYADVRTSALEGEWQEKMNAVWTDPKLIHGADVHDAVQLLHQAGIRPRLELEGDTDLAAAVHIGEDAAYFALYGYNRVRYTPEDPNQAEFAVSGLFQKGTTKSSYERPGRISRRSMPVSLNAVGAVYVMNPWTGSEQPLDFKLHNGRMEGVIEIEEDEMVILAVRSDEAPMPHQQNEQPVRTMPVMFDTLSFEVFGPQQTGEKSFLRSGYGPGLTIRLDHLASWYELDPALESFAGRGTYHGRLRLEQIDPDKRYVLCLGNVSDTFRVKVNGVETPFPDQVLKEADLTGLLQDGENELEICVVSNLYNRLIKGLMLPGMNIPLPYSPKKYGIWESEGKLCELRII